MQFRMLFKYLGYLKLIAVYCDLIVIQGREPQFSGPMIKEPKTWNASSCLNVS